MKPGVMEKHVLLCIIMSVLLMLQIWVYVCLTLLSKVLSRTKPNSWSLTKFRSFFPALMMVTMTSWRMASSGSWERTFRYSDWIIKRKTHNNMKMTELMGRIKKTQSRNKTTTQAKAHLSGLWPGLGGSWDSGWQTWHTQAWLEHGCHWTWRNTPVMHNEFELIMNHTLKKQWSKQVIDWGHTKCLNLTTQTFH